MNIEKYIKTPYNRCIFRHHPKFSEQLDKMRDVPGEIIYTETYKGQKVEWVSTRYFLPELQTPCMMCHTTRDLIQDYRGDHDYAPHGFFCRDCHLDGQKPKPIYDYSDFQTPAFNEKEFAEFIIKLKLLNETWQWGGTLPEYYPKSQNQMYIDQMEQEQQNKDIKHNTTPLQPEQLQLI